MKPAKRLSDEARAARAPRRPEELADALQDRVHHADGPLRAAQMAATPRVSGDEPAAVWVARSSLHAWADNPRKNDGEPVAKVAASIKRFGFASPIIARTNGEVIAGHTRLKAAEVLGLERVPVRYLDLDPVEARLLALADNRLGEEAEWHAAAVASLLSGYSLDDAALAGWDSDDLEELANELGALEPKEVTEDEVPEVPAVPTTKPGDLWLLGEHRVLCGDSTKAEDVARLMGGEKADLIWTDPPYGVNNVGGAKDPRDVKNYRSGGAVHNDDKTGDKLVAMVGEAIRNVPRRDSTVLYVASPSNSNVREMIDAFNSSGFEFRHSLVWVKSALVFGRCDYHYRHEFVLYGWGKKHEWAGPRNISTVFEFPMGDKTIEHPTSKPVELVVATAKNHPNLLMADPFLGSGTTLIAAEQLGRKCFGMEISPQYCDVIVKRWENLTGKTAALEAP